MSRSGRGCATQTFLLQQLVVNASDDGVALLFHLLRRQTIRLWIGLQCIDLSLRQPSCTVVQLTLGLGFSDVSRLCLEFANLRLTQFLLFLQLGLLLLGRKGLQTRHAHSLHEVRRTVGKQSKTKRKPVIVGPAFSLGRILDCGLSGLDNLILLLIGQVLRHNCGRNGFWNDRTLVNRAKRGTSLANRTKIRCSPLSPSALCCLTFCLSANRCRILSQSRSTTCRSFSRRNICRLLTCESSRICLSRRHFRGVASSRCRRRFVGLKCRNTCRLLLRCSTRRRQTRRLNLCLSRRDLFRRHCRRAGRRQTGTRHTLTCSSSLNRRLLSLSSRTRCCRRTARHGCRRDVCGQNRGDALSGSLSHLLTCFGTRRVHEAPNVLSKLLLSWSLTPDGRTPQRRSST